MEPVKTVPMVSLPIEVGQKRVKYMPYSEVCIHMRVAGTPMIIELLKSEWGYSVQLYNMDGIPFSFPITPGEAGIYCYNRNQVHGDMPYFYPDDSVWGIAPSVVHHSLNQPQPLEETITPEQASELLNGGHIAKVHEQNRPLNKRVVKKYAKDILEGNWQLPGETSGD